MLNIQGCCIGLFLQSEVKKSITNDALKDLGSDAFVQGSKRPLVKIVIPENWDPTQDAWGGEGLVPAEGPGRLGVSRCTEVTSKHLDHFLPFSESAFLY